MHKRSTELELFRAFTCVCSWFGNNKPEAASFFVRNTHLYIKLVRFIHCQSDIVDIQ